MRARKDLVRVKKTLVRHGHATPWMDHRRRLGVFLSVSRLWDLGQDLNRRCREPCHKQATVPHLGAVRVTCIGSRYEKFSHTGVGKTI
jgi:hypothetical protein